MESTAHQDDQPESLDTTGFVIAPLAAAAALDSAAFSKVNATEAIPATWEERARKAWEYYVEEPLVKNCVNSWRTFAVGDEIKITSDDETLKEQALGEKTDPDLAEVMNLLSGDRLFALVRLRQISLGDEVELELSCPNSACRMTNFVTINLEDLKVTPYGEEREFAFKLPGSKKAVRFGYLDGHKEKRLASLREPNITSAMLIRILDIDGKAPSKKSLAEMSMRDRNALRQEMSRVPSGWLENSGMG